MKFYIKTGSATGQTLNIYFSAKFFYVSVKIISDIHIPSAFTPNNDNLNDLWNIPALEAYPNSTISIYNRYGQLVFHSRGYARSWDGSYKGMQQSSGSYIYIIDSGDKKIGTLKGTVTILR